MPAVMQPDHWQSRAFDQIHAEAVIQISPVTGTFISAQKVREVQGKLSQLDIL